MRLIVVDGLDGVGKDTHAHLIMKRYEALGERLVVRSHPESDNFFGLQTKAALRGNGKVDKVRASIFYAFDVLRSLRRFYRKGEYDTVIFVRYLVGTAYLPFGLAGIAYRVFEKFVPVSEYMFFLDAEPDVLLRRIKRRKIKEIFEIEDSLVRVRKKALALVSDWNIIDTSSSVEETYSKIEGILDRLDKKSS